MGDLWPGRAGSKLEGARLRAVMTRENFERAVARCEMGKGVGVDGFNGYLLRQAPEAVRAEYWSLICTMIDTAQYPPEYKQWVAMLAMKGADEDPRELGRRRDLWVVCH